MVTITKEIKKLIEKYAISCETNTLYQSVMKLFDGRPNYQAWGLRMVFSNALTFEQLQAIAEWAENNSQLISSLKKKNIVAYNKKDALTLFDEMDFLNKDKVIKDTISHFNTEQRHMLMDWYKSSCGTNLTIDSIYKIFNNFQRLSMARKQKFYSSCSAVRSLSSLINLIEDCLNETYDWSLGKDDLLRFINNVTPDCDITYDKDNIIIAEVPSFKSSHLLCGSGRTQWCISREGSYWRSYVTDYGDKRRQYFLFDFNRKETDAFAHIGFTIERSRGIVEAQTCNNFSMMSSYSQGNETYSIHSLLEKYHIPFEVFMRLPRNLGYEWKEKYFLTLAKNNKKSIKVLYDKDSILILEIDENILSSDLLSKTFINRSQFTPSPNKRRCIAVLNFNVSKTANDAIVLLSVTKDSYNQEDITYAENIYGQKIVDENNANNQTNIEDVIHVNINEFIKNEELEPNLLLHKYIDNNKEEKALALLKSSKGKDIDVNFENNAKLPVYMAINQRMPRLFEAIVNHPSFNPEISDGLGETLVDSIIYLMASAKMLQVTQSDMKLMAEMITSIMNVPNYNFNVRNLGNSTTLHTVCEFPQLSDIAVNLIRRRYIDVNPINDNNETPLTVCLKSNNIKVIKALCQRPDLIITDSDKKLAAKMKIDLKSYVCPTEEIFNTENIPAFVMEAIPSID